MSSPCSDPRRTTVERVYVGNGMYRMNLNGASGSVNIQFSNIGGARGVYYEGSVDKDHAVVQIRNSYFTGIKVRFMLSTTLPKSTPDSIIGMNLIMTPCRTRMWTLLTQISPLTHRSTT